MRKIFALFLSLGIVVCDASESEIIKTEDAAESLQRAFNGEEPFYVITVTRIIDDGEPLFLDEAELVFSCVKLIAGHDKNKVRGELEEKLNEVREWYIKYYEKHLKKTLNDIEKGEKKQPHLFESYHLMAFLGNIIQNEETVEHLPIAQEKIARFFTVRQKKILKKFEEISTKSTKNIRDSWKLCVFNEMFFSKRMPISDEFREKILKNISALSDKKTLTHVNFLYHKQRKNKFTQNDLNRIRERLLPREQASGRPHARFVFGNTQAIDGAFLASYINNLSHLVTTNKRKLSYLTNESDILWDKKPVCYYKKSSYFHESDKSLIGDFIYDVGDGRDCQHPGLPREHSSVADITLKNLSSEICFDLCTGVRQENNWRNVTDADSKSKIHILVSNWVSLYNNFKFLPPHSSLIVHVDPILLNENVFALRKDIDPMSQNKMQMIFPSIRHLSSKIVDQNKRNLQKYKSIFDERLSASLDVSKLIKNNHINTIRLNFNNKTYMIQSYDLQDAIKKTDRGY